MKGSHRIVIESARLKYEFVIRRNLTIIQGDSATGKTTLMDLLSDYRRGNAPIRLESDVPCEVFSGGGERWRAMLELIQDSIVFIDEGNRFIRTKEFADTVRNSSNYFVLITREPLPELPYSIQEVYGIRTTGKYHFPEKIYHEFYPIYDGVSGETADGKAKKKMITEDSGAGNQFFQSFFQNVKDCIGAGGNSNVYRLMRIQDRETQLAIVADGAAFGAFAARVVAHARQRGKTMLYFPESFEWLILKSGVVADKAVEAILRQPEEHIDSAVYMSWERFFTELLEKSTRDDPVRHYQKNSLSPFYVSNGVKGKVVKVMPEQMQTFLEMLEAREDMNQGLESPE